MPPNESRAQSETLGFILVFALVLVGAGLTVAIGGSGIIDTQSANEFQRAENSMTLFDSRAAMVALGDARGQTVSLGQDSGSITVDEDSGWMRVTHTNYTEDNTTTREVIYNETLGQVVYESDQGTIAYQGGGVWRLQDGGVAQMVSPPEFHYRGATLTLPAIQVTGDGAAGGTVDMKVTPVRQAQLVYPNQTDLSSASNGTGAPYNETANTSYRNYNNPVRNGTISVTVKSDYSEGWEEYFRERTTGNITRLGENKVKLTLKTTEGAPGNFSMPAAGDSVNAGSVPGGHQIDRFDVTLSYDKNNPHFSFYAEEDPEEFEIHVYSDVKVKSKPCPDPKGEVHISVYYNNGSDDKQYEVWESDMVDPDSTDGMEWMCDGGDVKLKVDFISDDVTMHYDRIGNAGSYNSGSPTPSSGKANGSTGDTRGNKWAFNDRLSNDDGFSFRDPTVWDQHKDTVGYEPKTYNETETRSLQEVTNHYFSVMDDEVDLIAKHGPANKVPINTGASKGVLLYPESGGSQYVTYLHITKNTIEVDLD